MKGSFTVPPPFTPKLKLEQEFEEVNVGEKEASKHKHKTKCAVMEALFGAQERVKLVAADLVVHWEKPLETMNG